MGKDIKTEVGICQGDCLSPILFIFYLAHAIKELPTHIEKEDYARLLWSELDWLIQKDQHQVEIDPKYADDVSFLRSNESKVNQVKRMIPNMLEEYNLIINQDKTEMYKISRKSDEEWINVCIWDQCLVQKKTSIGEKVYC